MSINSVNQVGQSQYSTTNVNFKSKTTIKPETLPSEDKGLSTGAKWTIGVGLTVLGALGVYAILRGRAKSAIKTQQKNAAKEIEKLRQLFSGMTGEDKKIIDHILKNTETLPPEKQTKVFKYLRNLKHRFYDLNNYECGVKTIRGEKFSPKVVKYLKEGRKVKAAQELEKQALSLPNTYKAKTTGTTVAETIENVFGKGSKEIKPHSYDLAKESDHFLYVRYRGGYWDRCVTKEGVLREPRYFNIDKALSESYSNINGFLQNPQKVSKVGKEAVITHGITDGKYVTVMDIPERTREGISMKLGFISKDGKPTPFQKDLLSLAENPERFDYDLIKKTLINEKNALGDHMDYGLMLSVIQSMAKGMK